MKFINIPLLFLIFFLAPLSTLADSPGKPARKGLSEECYQIVHEDQKATKEQKEECLSKFYGITTLIITPTRTARDPREIPAPLSVVNKKEINRSSADSVAELLRDVPGVEITDAGQAGQKRIRIRGESARRVLLLIDGQEFTDQREVGTPVLIAPEMIEQIEIIKGPGSILYGSKAIGGVINIITKKGGYHPAQLSASSSYDSATEGRQHFGSIFGNIGDVDYRVSATQADFGDRNTAGGDIPNTSFESESFSAYLGTTVDNHAIAFSYENFNSDSEVFVADEVRFHPPFVDFSLDIPKRDREKFAVFYDFNNEGDLLEKVHLDAFKQDSERQFNTFSDLLLNIGFPLSRQSSIYTFSELRNTGITAQTDWRISEENRLIVGAQLVSDKLEQDRLRQVTNNGRVAPDEFVRDEASRRSFSVFAQDEHKISEDLAVDIGARAFWLNSDLDLTTRPGLSTNSNSDDSVVGSIGVSYTGLEDITLWLRAAQGYLYPSLGQSAVGAFAGSDFVNPNASLEPETSETFDIGFRYNSSSVNFDSSAFITLAEDMIDFIRCADATATCITPAGRNDRVYVNTDRAKTFGVETTLSYTQDNITPYFSLAWIRRKITMGDFYTYDTGLPTLSSKAGVRYQHDFNSLTNGWIDLFVQTSTDSDESESPGSIEHKAGWATLNAIAGVEFGENNRFRLLIEGRNLLDKDYTPATENLVAPGASVLVKLGIDL